MVLIGLVSMVLRLAELVFAAIVAGLNGEYLHEVRDFAEGRFIYTEVIAGVAIFFSLIWLIPLAGGFVHWLLEFVISIGWFVAFGLLVQVSHIVPLKYDAGITECAPASTWTDHAAQRSTGPTSASEANNVASGKQSLPFHFCRQSVGLLLVSLGLFGSTIVKTGPTAAVLGATDLASTSIITWCNWLSRSI
ncbi:hypothetical protein GGS21DRAFT_398313 [Xylaria nigripes]|nr:hypothetical protein GGS21DRAFT_398313 [Xylaria nigripes]